MDTILRHANLVDVINGGIKRVSILITGDTIAQIAESESIAASSGYEVTDLAGSFVTPGLIDLHTHLIWSGGEDPARTVEEEGIHLSLLRAARNARVTAEAGITTVRDLGSHENAAIALGKAIERGYVIGPRIVPSGCTIIMTGGHDPFWGIQGDGETEMLKAVRKQVLAGAKVIKVSATGGVYGRLEGEEVGTAELTEREQKAIRDEAHRFGLKVAAHAISEQGIENCIGAGIDTIEHGHFLTENQMGRMIEKGMWWTPTLFVYRQIAQGDTIPPYAMEKARRIVDIHRNAFRKAVARGVPIVAGSDAGSPNTPHTSLLNELECMEEYGYQPIEILRAATSRAAQALGMEAQIGSIEVGKKADLVVVSRNPLEKITNLRNAVLVMKGGETLIRKATNKEQGLSLFTT